MTTAPFWAPLRRRATTRSLRPRLLQWSFWTISLTALGYAPLAMNYMGRYLSRGAPQWQGDLTAAVDGRSYAIGYGSVDWLRATDYENNRWVMLIHTTLGGLCLVLAVLQFAGPIRRNRRFHRWCGRLFVDRKRSCRERV